MSDTIKRSDVDWSRCMTEDQSSTFVYLRPTREQESAMRGKTHEEKQSIAPFRITRIVDE